MGSCRMLDKSGDITFAWESDNDEAVAVMIQKKMDQGVRFFIVQPFAGSEVEITRIEDIVGRELRVHDEDFAKLLTEGKAGILSRAGTAIKDGAMNLVRRVTDAREAAAADTLAMRQPAGG
jgi:hypothetical protein